MGAYCCPSQCNYDDPDYICLDGQPKHVESRKNPNGSGFNNNKIKNSKSPTDQYINKVFQKKIFSNYNASESFFEDTSVNESLEENVLDECTSKKEISRVSHQINNYDGAYLIYTEANNGSLLTSWSTSKLPNALIFAQRKPNLFIPNFRYRQKSVVISSIHIEQKNVLEGVLLFLKSIRAFQSKVFFFNVKDSLGQIAPIFFLFYTDQNKVSVLSGEDEAENLMETKMIASCFLSEKCVNDFIVLKNQAYVEFQDFECLCVKYSNILCTSILKQ
ncbi:uncharacterized protein LOC128883636 isoform X2 [Hylaeus volcanicus]|uniref:uncharacterized protein LOC128883636 isoform X2 n=1 Tax=Hylaeus volcanicus TaxID=313075 RepID=UPI0023B8692C|nr:uncharacterized protein LOC128883636 isoform X2 [Hylaeus volcanicus]